MALLLVTAIVLLYGVIYPNLSVAISSFQRAGTWTLANYTEILSQRIVLEAIVSSLGLSVATVLFCALVGVPLAFLFERYTFPGRRLFAALAALPLVLGPEQDRRLLQVEVGRVGDLGLELQGELVDDVGQGAERATAHHPARNASARAHGDLIRHPRA